MRRSAGLAGLIALLVATALPAIARAEFGIAPGSEELSVLDAAGQPESRAGSHPDRLTVKFGMNTVEGNADGNLKDIVIDLPPGLNGEPNGVPACPRKVFDGAFTKEECPSDTQVGKVELTLPLLGKLEMSIFNVAPAPGEMAALGAVRETLRLPISMQLRPGDHGTTLTIADLFQTLPITGAEIELWGIPADHQEEPVAPRLPFLTLPGRCDEPLALTLHVDSWQEPGAERSAEVADGPKLTGCDSLSFAPSVAFAMDSPAADAPSGARVEIAAPDGGGPDDRANAQIRSAVVSLPGGVTLSPAGIAGIEACSDAQFGLGSATPAACPAASRIGSVEMTSPLLRGTGTGELYMGRERPGERFRLFADAGAPGVEVKLAGRLAVDPATGRLTVSLVGLPQIPLERMTLSFDGGPRAPLATPLDCDPLRATARFDSYSGASRDASSAAEDRGGPACHGATGFEPDFTAGGSATGAGEDTTLSITVKRRDGERLLDRLLARLPRGISPALGSVEQCAAPAAATGACPAGSRIGSAVAEVGSGPEPVTLHGDIFLTGRYRRAPFGLALTFQARLGGFDAGRLVVRGGLTMDPRTGRATIETGSLPQIVEGVPIRFRTVGLDIDRPGFVGNPTSCEAQSVEATIVAVGGAGSDATTPFRVGGCGSLRFHPAISIALHGAKRLHRRGKPGLRMTLRSPQGSTGLRAVRIPLPRIVKLSPTGPQELCARPEAIAGDCPAGSRVGAATAMSALFGGWMGGSIYVVQPAGNGLPDLWTDLGKQGLHIMVRARTSVRKGRVITSLAGMPDVPVSALSMRFGGGSRGIFALRRGLCGRRAPKRLLSSVAFAGQDGAFRMARERLRHPRCIAAAGGESRRG